MGLIDWYKDTFWGKIDPNAIYNGMSDDDRRNPLLRMQFIEDKQSKYESDFKNHLKNFGNESTNKNAEVKKYKLLIMSKIYERARGLTGEPPANLQDRVLSSCFEWMNTSNDVTSDLWKEVLAQLKSEEVVVALLPKLFTAEFAQEWEKAKARKIKVEEDRKKKIEAEREKKKPLYDALKNAEDQLSRLKSIFYSMSPGPSRTQITVSIDSTERYISRLKQELNI